MPPSRRSNKTISPKNASPPTSLPTITPSPKSAFSSKSKPLISPAISVVSDVETLPNTSASYSFNTPSSSSSYYKTRPNARKVLLTTSSDAYKLKHRSGPATILLDTIDKEEKDIEYPSDGRDSENFRNSGNFFVFIFQLFCAAAAVFCILWILGGVSTEAVKTAASSFYSIIANKIGYSILYFKSYIIVEPRVEKQSREAFQYSGQISDIKAKINKMNALYSDKLAFLENEFKHLQEGQRQSRIDSAFWQMKLEAAIDDAKSIFVPNSMGVLEVKDSMVASNDVARNAIGTMDASNFAESIVDWSRESLGGSIRFVETNPKELSWLNGFSALTLKLVQMTTPSHMSHIFTDYISEEHSLQRQPSSIILKNKMNPGECFAFPGNSGEFIITMSRPITPHRVSVAYPSPAETPYHEMAPFEFSVYTEAPHGSHKLLNTASSASVDEQECKQANAPCDAPSLMQQRKNFDQNMNAFKNFDSNTMHPLRAKWLFVGNFTFKYPSSQLVQYYNVNKQGTELNDCVVNSIVEDTSHPSTGQENECNGKHLVTSRVKFVVHSNYGGGQTCIYHLGVHGERLKMN